MRKIFLSLLFAISVYSEDNKINVEVYTLENGMTVLLNEDHNESSVFGAIAVKGGGKQDPEDATGIAHYLEHMLFKGTAELGTVDYETENIFLDSIEILYDQLGTISNTDRRLSIQKSINDLNIEAAKYAGMHGHRFTTRSNLESELTKRGLI